MSSAETRYSTAVSLDGFYEVVVASEGVEPYIGHGWLSGIDKAPPNFVIGERLAVPEGTPNYSVILIKGNPGGGPEICHRIFQMLGGQLQELASNGRVGGWAFDKNTGSLTQEDSTGPYRVSPGYWGYCKIVEGGWAPGTHWEQTMQEAGNVAMHCSGTGGRNLALVALNRIIAVESRVGETEDALRLIADKLLSQDLLDACRDVTDKHKQKGHLRALTNSTEPTQHSAAGVVIDLRSMHEVCREALPDLPELPPNALDA